MGVVLLTTPDALSAQWAVKPLGFLNMSTTGTFVSDARGVNSSGQVVGMSHDANGNWQAFITGPDGTGMTGLGFLNTGTTGSFYSSAMGVNEVGQVVGASHDGNGNAQAFMTGPDGTGMRGLGFLNTGTTGKYMSNALGINASGQVVGESYDSNGNSQAFVTGANGAGMRGLGFLNTGTTGEFFSAAMGINESGQVVGYSYDSEYAVNVPRPDGTPVSRYYQAFVTGPNAVGMTGLGFINPPSANLFISNAAGINASGQVAGSSAGYNNWSQAFFHDLSGGMRGLGHLNAGSEGYRESWGRGINASGQVVGENWSSNFGQQGFITGANGIGMFSLGDLLGSNGLIGWSIESAAAISDNGYVAAFGYNTSTGIAPQALLIRIGEIPSTNVPEPASLTLMASGLLALGVVARRRRIEQR
jgi:probable HAF family extracellular repeat protein